MWTILEHKDVHKQMQKAPTEIRKKYETWKAIVRQDGPAGVHRIRGLRDEALKGKWQGFRSSRLNLQYRVIYSIDGGAVTVNVRDVNPHDYRR
jgi:addiction module RelE/StbE family toxin